MSDEVVIPFTQEEYGVTLVIIVETANRIIKESTPGGNIDPRWPLIVKFFQAMHGATLKPNPWDNSLLQVTIPEAAKGSVN